MNFVSDRPVDNKFKLLSLLFSMKVKRSVEKKKPEVKNEQESEANKSEEPPEECVVEENPLHPALQQDDAFSRTSLLLSTAQLMQEKYPLPVQYSNGISKIYMTVKFL